MRKEIFILSLTLILSFTGLQAQTIIDQGTCGSNLTWVYTSDSILTINGNGAMNNYSNIPGNRSPWAAYQGIMKTVVLGDSVTTIGNYAFYWCNMTSIIIGSLFVTMGINSFYNCRSLMSINVDTNNLLYSSINGILYNKLQDTLILCPLGRMGTVIIPNSVITIGNSAFASCERLTSVIIPNSVITIGNSAFASCERLTSVIIPNSVITIGNSAFYNSGLTSITIPNSVITIGNHAFVSFNAFYGYYINFDSIICKAIIPPVINLYTIGDNATMPIYVPCNSFNAYKTADYWKNYTNFIGMPDTTFIFDTICHGRVYNGNGFSIHNGKGIYYRTMVTPNNCSRVFCLALSEYSFDSITHYSETICQGDTFSDDNFSNLTQAGDYYDTLQNINGCDSIIKLTLTVNSVYIISDTADICQGENYNFFGKLLTKQGIYYDTLQTIDGCDSIIELMLTVNPIYFTSDTVSITQGETYNFNDKILTEAGVYYDTLQTIFGCDSVFELNLTYETSIAEKQLSNIRIYPNPTTGQLTVESGQLTIEDIKIYDLYGKNIVNGQLSTVNFLNISYLPTGIYLLKIKTEKGIISQKIVKY